FCFAGTRRPRIYVFAFAKQTNPGSNRGPRSCLYPKRSDRAVSEYLRRSRVHRQTAWMDSRVGSRPSNYSQGAELRSVSKAAGDRRDNHSFSNRDISVLRSVCLECRTSKKTRVPHKVVVA